MNIEKKSLSFYFIQKIKRFFNTKEKKEIINSFSWLFFDKILRLGIGLIVGIWIAKYLGPNTYGFWNYATAFSGLFMAFATMGVDSIVIKELMIYPSQSDHILGTAFVIRFLGSLLTLILSTTIFYYFKFGNSQGLEIVFITSSCFLLQSFDVIDLYFQAKVKSRYTVISKNVSFLIFVLIRIYLITGKYNLMYFVWCNFYEVLLSEIIINLYAIKHRIEIYNWKIDLKRGKNFLSNGWFLMLTSIMILIYMKIDQVMLGYMAGNNEVGIYSVAVRISEVWYFIPLAITTSVFPSQIKSKSESNQIYFKRFKDLFFYFALISISLSLLTSLFSGLIIKLLFGQDYARSALLLSINIWAGVFVFSGLGSSQFLIIENLYSLSFYRTLTGAVSNILLNLLFIPHFKAMGSALATLISYFISAILMNYFDKRTRSIFFIQLKSLYFHDQIIGLIKMAKININRKKIR